MPNNSIRLNTDSLRTGSPERLRATSTDRIRAACQELEDALENFNRTRDPNSHATEGPDSDSSAKEQNAHTSQTGSTPARLEQIQTQLANIRRQIDELS